MKKPIPRWARCAGAAVLGLLWLGASSCKRPPALRPASEETPSAPVAKVIRTNLQRVVVIPAEFRPYVAVALHAKVSGYLQTMKVDFGDRVKAGELLATIEVPELRDQLNNALAEEAQAEANYTNAHLIYQRLMSVNRQHPNLIAQQDIDDATAKDLAARAAITAAQAEAGRYRTLVSYTQITAPFDGIVTRRSMDPGALVAAGTATEETIPLLEISDNYRLRLDFPVSVEYVSDIRVGNRITGVVESLDGMPFSGKITRAAWQVNDDTRTMTTEIEVENTNLQLVPGMYARVSVPVELHPNALAVPIQAVPPGATNTLYLVNAQNVVEERLVKLGMETPGHVEVLSGVREGEWVLTGSRGLYYPGEKVDPVPPATNGPP